MQTTTARQYLIVRSTGTMLGDADDLLDAYYDDDFQGAFLVGLDATVTPVGVEQDGDSGWEIVGGEGDEVDELIEYVEA